MAIKVRQHDDGTVYWEVGPQWTVAELYAAHTQTRTLLERSPRPARLLINASYVRHYPRANLVPPFQLILKNAGVDTLIYVHSRVDTTLIEMVVNLARHHLPPATGIRQVRFAHSMAEAERLLHQSPTPVAPRI